MQKNIKKITAGLALTFITINTPKIPLSDQEQKNFQTIITSITTGIATQNALLPKTKTPADIKTIIDAALLKYKPGADTSTALINALVQINAEKDLVSESDLSDDEQQKILTRLNALTSTLDTTTLPLMRALSPTTQPTQAASTINDITTNKLPTTLNRLAIITTQVPLKEAQAALNAAKINQKLASKAVYQAQQTLNRATKDVENLARQQANATNSLSSAQQQLARATTKQQQQKTQNAIDNATTLLAQIAAKKNLADQAVITASNQLAPLVAAQTAADQAVNNAQTVVDNARATLQTIRQKTPLLPEENSSNN